MSYTARDYTALEQALASSLSDARHTDISAEACIGNCINDIADALARLNPNFNRERFNREIESLTHQSKEKVQ